MGKVSCDLCGLTCTSVRSLCEHVIGVKHKTLLARFAPAKLRDLGRVQHFLDTYLKQEAVLGLEYLVERRVNSTYLYTCLLCNVEYEWRKMVAHITDVDHTESYIYKHHSDMTSASSHLTREEQVQALEEAARVICAKFGRKEVQKCEAAVGERNGDAPQTGGGALERPSQEQMMSAHGRDDMYDALNYDCSLCDVKCASPVALCEHIVGNKHKRNLQRTAPDQLHELGRLHYFLRTHLKEDPIVGLEYILEIKHGPSYKYSCQLCSLDTDLLKMVVHMTDVEHMERYIKKHHGDLLPGLPKFSKKVALLKTLRDVAVKIVEKHGRKEIRLKNTPDGGTRGAGALTSKCDSGNGTQAQKRPLPYQKGLDERQENDSYPKMLKKS